MSIARTSHRQSARLFPQLHKWHIIFVRAGEQKDVMTRPNRSRGWTAALCTDRRHHEKFATAEVKRGMAKSTSCRAFAALNESVSRSVTAKVLDLGEKADSRQSRFCSDCRSRRACWMGAERCMRQSGGACALTRDQSVASAAHALYHTFEIEQGRPIGSSQ
jgi:hypothetical protein